LKRSRPAGSKGERRCAADAPARDGTAEVQGDRQSPLPARLRIGRVIGAHGLHGALRLKPDYPETEILAKVARIWLERDGVSREFRLTGVTRVASGSLRITLDGVGDANAADAFKGAALTVAVADLPAAGPREFYYFQALGCEVVTPSGERIGTVAEVFSNGAQDILVVRDGAREVLVPAIEDIVRHFDVAGRRITIEPVPGLLD
jgi:16S rRNA processing protein RimM